ncbi:hypothetical protein [uncultured Microbulbifer sp.]|uniref:hypothetical protein n=1 Tax=uncultured Microbulbifer sp. TaxID=348147 RepID=UPI002610024A|nr:hypothetical protein [uncultured Microbulbifer sp.]
MKGHIIAQLKGVAAVIGGDFPALCQRRDQLGRAGLEIQQTVVQRWRRGVSRRSGQGDLRVEGFRAAFGTVNQAARGKGWNRYHRCRTKRQ